MKSNGIEKQKPRYQRGLQKYFPTKENNMENYTEHKASYQLNCFINSDLRYNFNLSPYEISILYILVRYLDMPRKICCLSQEKFAKEAGMNRREFQRRCNQMHMDKLIFRYQHGKGYRYELGEIITGITFD